MPACLPPLFERVLLLFFLLLLLFVCWFFSLCQLLGVILRTLVAVTVVVVDEDR